VGGFATAGNATLACGYENQAFQAIYLNKQDNLRIIFTANAKCINWKAILIRL